LRTQAALSTRSTGTSTARRPERRVMGRVEPPGAGRVGRARAQMADPERAGRDRMEFRSVRASVVGEQRDAVLAKCATARLRNPTAANAISLQHVDAARRVASLTAMTAYSQPPSYVAGSARHTHVELVGCLHRLDLVRLPHLSSVNHVRFVA